jgi:hypothetical protein
VKKKIFVFFVTRYDAGAGMYDTWWGLIISCCIPWRYISA